jgi:NAD(P)-dependent dehydrogenase (short-subunit alcohol dehydrogenase family)
MMARALDANGAARVFIVGRREEQLKQTAATGKNGTLVPLVGDVTSKESLSKITDQVSKECDHLDVLICNSGSSGPRSQPPAKTDGTSPTLAEIRDFCWNVPMEEFEQVNTVNVTGVFYTCLAFLPLLEATNKMRPIPSNVPRPQIIATSSAGAFNRVPLAGFAYTASKAGVVQLMKSMSTLLGNFDIRCNIIAPGLYHSEMSAPVFQLWGIENGHEEGKFDRNIIPATRSGHEEDIAGLILWLCSKAGAYINGTVVVTDGGRLGVIPSSY